MTTQLTNILITDWSDHHVSGYDLNSGNLVSHDLNTSVSVYETFGYDMDNWSAGDIATLRLDEGENLARLRFMTPKALVVKTGDFQIIDITHTSLESNKTDDVGGRHIYLKGSAKNGAVYILPMLGYTSWHKAWDFSQLVEKIKTAQNKEPQQSQLSVAINSETIYSLDDRFKPRIDEYNEIFYSGTKQAGTLFDRATSLTIRTLTVTQTAPSNRIAMLAAAFVKKFKSDDEEETSNPIKMGIAFSPPYFMIDGEKVFIRTGSEV